MPKIEFNKTDTKQLIKMYNEGFGLVDVAAEFGISVTTVRRILTDNDVEIRPRGRPTTTND